MRSTQAVGTQARDGSAAPAVWERERSARSVGAWHSGGGAGHRRLGFVYWDTLFTAASVRHVTDCGSQPNALPGPLRTSLPTPF